jgi:D-alanine-D-alanine ligase
VAVDVTQIGKVAVLMGGLSAEREISLLSGSAVDGTIQGLLELMNMPYTGSGVMASSLAMDKLKTKQIWQAMGLSTPAFYILDSEESCERALEVLSLPLIIKPVLEGSSIGMSKVEIKNELIPAWEKAQRCGGTVIAESWIEGDEYTAAVLDDQVLPMIKLKTTHKFYDYDAKYEAQDTEYICPCGLSEQEELNFSELTKKAFNAVSASAWGRVDFMVDQNNKPWLIEVNTVPGMTSHSLVPMAAKQAGMSFDDLTLNILALSTCEHC